MRSKPDPRFEIAVRAVEAAKSEKAELVIGIGGGVLPLDIAKVRAILATNTKPVSELFGIDMVPEAGLATILIPTTAGTGSEVTPIAILSDEHEKLKKESSARGFSRRLRSWIRSSRWACCRGSRRQPGRCPDPCGRGLHVEERELDQ